MIVVPAYDEEQALPGTLAELREHLPDAEVLVVDDGSRDATSLLARAAGADVVRLPFNLGVGAAVRAGLRWARDHGYDRAVVVDADGQHDPAAIKALLDALDGGADLAVGSRFAPGAPPYPVGRLRRVAMRLLARVVRRTTHLLLTDVTSGFRAFDRPVIELLAREYPAEYLADTVEVLLIVHAAGYRIVEVPAAMRPRTVGTASQGGWRLVVNLARLLVGIASFAYRRRLPEPRSRPGGDR